MRIVFHLLIVLYSSTLLYFFLSLSFIQHLLFYLSFLLQLLVSQGKGRFPEEKDMVQLFILPFSSTKVWILYWPLPSQAFTAVLLFPWMPNFHPEWCVGMAGGCWGRVLLLPWVTQQRTQGNFHNWHHCFILLCGLYSCSSYLWFHFRDVSATHMVNYGLKILHEKFHK